MSNKLVIIDYGMGNLFSVQNALKTLGIEAVISSDKTEIENADKLILPGVGAFPDAMKNLKSRGLIEILNKEVLEKKKPILGICLGIQLFGGVGEEHEITNGLGWIPGKVRRFKVDESKFRVPHVGWNDVKPKAESKLFQGITEPVFYFVHSFHLVPENQEVISGTCDYGETFVAAIESGNIYGVQFHPEKSQKNGLKVLENFLKI